MADREGSPTGTIRGSDVADQLSQAVWTVLRGLHRRSPLCNVDIRWGRRGRSNHGMSKMALSGSARPTSLH